MSKEALILVDLQNDYFPEGKWELKGIEAATKNAARLLSHARETSRMVIHVQHFNRFAEAPFFVEDSTGAEIHPIVAPAADEPVIVKQHANSFRETDLQKILEEAKVEQLTIVGAMSHMCIAAIARAGADLGYQVRVVEDACATRDLEFKGQTIPAEQVHGAFMAALAFGYAQIVSTQEVI